jgi:hypothetical protein
MAKSKGIVHEFREFIARGNVIDLAIGVIIGAAFNKIVTSLVEGILMPFVGLFTGRIDFASMFYVLDKSKGIPVSLAEAPSPSSPTASSSTTSSASSSSPSSSSSSSSASIGSGAASPPRRKSRRPRTAPSASRPSPSRPRAARSARASCKRPERFP